LKENINEILNKKDMQETNLKQISMKKNSKVVFDLIVYFSFFVNFEKRMRGVVYYRG
jgi:hypothetical protein